MDINVAFCFDERLTDQVQATVASLLDCPRSDGAHYHIYCVCTAAAAHVEEPLRRIITARDEGSLLTVRAVENPFGDAYEVRGISAGTYLRLTLHELFPDLDKILYVDVDVLFRDSLEPIWQTPIDGHVLAAVKGAVNFSDKWEWNSARPYWKELAGMRGRYINAGVTLMNLAEIRRRNLEKQWLTWTKEKLYYQDQDILNITCQGAIKYLPPRYNRLAYMDDREYDRFVSEGIYTVRECEEALQHPAIIHYAGDKPWKRYDANLGQLWWDYVNSQPELRGLFDEAAARKYHGPTVLERGVRKLKRLFGGEKMT